MADSDNRALLLTPSGGSLTQRECEILALLAEGLSNHAIADRLSLAEKTVKNRLSIIFDKLQVDNRTQAACWALNNGLAEFHK
jgi:DNA-binding NarL/FixJ family response regulator